MDREIKNIQLKFNCPANWEEMTVVDGGRFCSLCEKTVYDFTDAKQREFLMILAENGGNICGRFRREQMAVSHAVIPGWKKWLSAAMVLVGINVFGNKAMAQNKPTANEKHQTIDENANGFVGAIEVEPTFIGDMRTFIQHNLHYTADMKPGKVFAQFIVSTNGQVSDVKIVRGLSPQNDSEVIRVIKLTRWKPATQAGKAVMCQYTIPIAFSKPEKD